jgi:hypothetical protein
MVRAQLFAYIAYVGKIPQHQRIISSCGHKNCCNPQHLHLASRIRTQEEKQALRKPKKRLTIDEKIQLTHDYYAGISSQVLANQYNIGIGRIAQIAMQFRTQAATQLNDRYFQQYAKGLMENGWRFCPFCGGGSDTANTIILSTTNTKIVCCCKPCGKQWQEIYSLVRIECL